MNAPRVEAKGEVCEKAISRAVGEELRRTREAKGWSRQQLVSRLPSGIRERTVLSYEHGTRQLNVVRLVELCDALTVAPPTLLNQALQRAQLTWRVPCGGNPARTSTTGLDHLYL